MTTRAELRGAPARSLRGNAFVLLDALYATSEPDAQKLAEKGAILARLREALHYPRAINNATLLQYQTYHSGQEELASLLALCGGDFPRGSSSPWRDSSRRAFPKAQENDVEARCSRLIDARCPESVSIEAPTGAPLHGGHPHDLGDQDLVVDRLEKEPIEPGVLGSETRRQRPADGDSRDALKKRIFPHFLR